MNNRHYLLDYIEEAIKDKDLDTVKFTLEKIRTKGIQISNSNTPLLYLAVEQQAENIFFYLLEQLNNQEKKLL